MCHQNTYVCGPKLDSTDFYKQIILYFFMIIISVLKAELSPEFSYCHMLMEAVEKTSWIGFSFTYLRSFKLGGVGGLAVTRLLATRQQGAKSLQRKAKRGSSSHGCHGNRAARAIPTLGWVPGSISPWSRSCCLPLSPHSATHHSLKVQLLEIGRPFVLSFSHE